MEAAAFVVWVLSCPKPTITSWKCIPQSRELVFRFPSLNFWVTRGPVLDLTAPCQGAVWWWHTAHDRVQKCQFSLPSAVYCKSLKITINLRKRYLHCMLLHVPLLLNLVDCSDVIPLQGKVFSAIWVFMELTLTRFDARWVESLFSFFLIYLWAFQQFFWSVKEWTGCCNLLKKWSFDQLLKGNQAKEVVSARAKERDWHYIILLSSLNVILCQNPYVLLSYFRENKKPKQKASS